MICHPNATYWVLGILRIIYFKGFISYSSLRQSLREKELVRWFMTVFLSRKVSIPETNNELFDLDSRGYVKSLSVLLLSRISVNGMRTHPRQQIMSFSPESTWFHSSTLRTSCWHITITFNHFHVVIIWNIPLRFLLRSGKPQPSGYKLC